MTVYLELTRGQIEVIHYDFITKSRTSKADAALTQAVYPLGNIFPV